MTKTNHMPNFASGTVWTEDNLNIMRGINSECIDLIYLDPPFNSNANYAAPIGSEAAGAAFKDTWGLTDIDLAWGGTIKKENPGVYNLLTTTATIHGKSMMAYLIYMAIRIIEMKRILKATGSVYLHCDPTASHYLKLLMDAIFGRQNFRNEIVWFYTDTPGRPKSDFPRKHDVIIRYAKGDIWTFNDDQIKIDIKEDSKKRYQYARTLGGKITIGGDESGKIPEDVWQIPSVKKNSKESKGYPTQKPLALLERIIKASSNQGDMVFDPFCGCATTMVAADRLQRQWAGIDLSPIAVELVKERINDDRKVDKQKASGKGLFGGAISLTQPPQRTDLGKIPPYNCKENRDYLYGIQGGHCNGCGEHFLKQNLTIDHYVPISKGGSDHVSNLQMLCAYCNSVKGERAHAYLITRLIELKRIKRVL